MKNIIHIRKLSKDYIKIPRQIYNVGLSVEALGLFVYLTKHSEEYNPSEYQIARELKKSRNTIRKYIKELEHRGILALEYSGGFNTIKKYSFTNPRNW